MSFLCLWYLPTCNQSFCPALACWSPTTTYFNLRSANYRTDILQKSHPTTLNQWCCRVEEELMAVDSLQQALVFPVFLLPFVAQGVSCPLGHRWCTRPSCHTYALQAATAQPPSDSGVCILYIHSHKWVGTPPPTTGGGHCSTIGAFPSIPSARLLLWGHWPLICPFCPHLSHSLLWPQPQETHLSHTDVSNCIDPCAHRTGWKPTPQRSVSVRFQHPGWEEVAQSRPQRTWSALSSPPLTSYTPSAARGQNRGGPNPAHNLFKWVDSGCKTQRASFHGSFFPTASGGVEKQSALPRDVHYLWWAIFRSDLATLVFFSTYINLFFTVYHRRS